jgi:hypothetical protein
MTGLWKAWKAKGRLPTLSTSPLGISPKAGKIPTFPQLRRFIHVSYRTASKKRIGQCGPWKSGNPKPGFPLSHRPDSLRQQGGKTILWKKARAIFGSEAGTVLRGLAVALRAAPRVKE